MSAPDRVTVRIEHLVVDTRRPVDGFALQVALGEAIRDVICERGLPDVWQRSGAVPTAVLSDLEWDGRGGETGLARCLAEYLHTGAPRADGSAEAWP